MEEVWKEIPFANKYEASSFGNIRNKKTKKVRKKQNIEKLKKKQTRVRMGLILNDGSTKGYYLHRIIAQTFLSQIQTNIQRLIIKMEIHIIIILII